MVSCTVHNKQLKLAKTAKKIYYACLKQFNFIFPPPQKMNICNDVSRNKRQSKRALANKTNKNKLNFVFIPGSTVPC